MAQDKPAATGLPFMNSMADTMDFMTRMWGGGGLPAAAQLPQALPSMMTPTMDVAELDKRIADLRAVEHWLHLNMGMLRTTIQSLEVQRNTIATLKGFNAALMAGINAAATPADERAQMPQAGTPPAPAASDSKAGAAPGTLQGNAEAWWALLQDQFNRVAGAAAASAPAAEPPAGAGGKTAAKGRK